MSLRIKKKRNNSIVIILFIFCPLTNCLFSIYIFCQSYICPSYLVIFCLCLSLFVHSQRGRWVCASVYMYTVQCAVCNVHVHITHFICLCNCVLKGTVIPTRARIGVHIQIYVQCTCATYNAWHIF